jgi:probable F420-dependent oxidoreductase
MNAPPFRFGVVFTGNYGASEWTDAARRLEAEGISTMLVADHYYNPMACGPLMLAAAAATTTLRVGSYVYNNDFRHPALLAKEAATIDVLSGGRLELGIGAGWLKEEYDAVGLTFDPARMRADRFEEGIEIVTRLLAGERVTFAGQHYHLDDVEGLPIPTQRPVPLLVGGSGPRMLRLAAQKAQIVGFVPRSLPNGGIDPSDFVSLDGKMTRLDRELAAAGRTETPPERSILIFGIFRTTDEVPGDWWTSPDLVSRSPYVLLGDVEAMVDALHERRERLGLSYFVCFYEDLERFLPLVRRLAS